MKPIVRFLAIAGLLGFWLLRLSACLLGIVSIVGWGWAPILAALLLWLRLIVVLQLAVLLGALMVWHLPLVAALLLAVPRLLLMLPGLISTFLAGRRHPRVPWTS